MPPRKTDAQKAAEAAAKVAATTAVEDAGDPINGMEAL